MQTALAGKTALVTGGSRGLGAAIARALAQAGADVAVSYVSSPDKADSVIREIRAIGRRAVAYRADQSDTAGVAGLVDSVVADLGGLDILVNNAGVVAYGALGDDSADHPTLDRLREVNIDGVITTIRAAANVLGAGGRIITVGSTLAARASTPGVADYAASKAAIIGYTKGAARDLAPRGITANVIQAGAFATDMNPPDGPTADQQRSWNPMGRFGRPEELAAGVVFLASPAASYITGTVLTIDGGALA
ncbi:SDR family oxidoreductase [Nocardia panacis]|uniref:SDR family oxidoreductase n=1 Tax=Nocardia panacis TaxID=2340916 RepID=A0A3A4KBF1_9NOCA|nr:SDR family oxidoreductase [Nocardia panacis]RJO70931.1 SDR family oxidoreductase [Nocardia panacis]